jgi:hypothetical protein
LLDAGNDAPRGTACADDVLVSHGQKVTLVNGELAADLDVVLAAKLYSAVASLYDRVSTGLLVCKVRVPLQLPIQLVSIRTSIFDLFLSSTNLHVADHLCRSCASAYLHLTSRSRAILQLTIVALGLLAQPGEESLAA